MSVRFLQIFVTRHPVARRGKPGGFNLLPYRERDRRRARQRCVLEWIGAAFVGGIAVLILAGWQAFQGARLEAERATIEHSLAQFAAPLAEQATLLRDAKEREARAAQAGVSSASLTHLLALMEALSEDDAADSGGVVLQEMRHRPHETEFRAMAGDHVAPAAWLKRLAAVPGAGNVEMSELHRTQPGIAQPASSPARGQVEFAARLRWAGTSDEPKRPPVPAGTRSTQANKQAR
ncbi:Tfp pilus assembly protein PilN [Paraburkholderia sp. GAS42]|jgi:Tfp pilus assembly protein PilN